MTEPSPLKQTRATVTRFAVHGAWIGAILGLALSLLLRNVFGPPQHYLAKTIGIIAIVATFGGFVGVLTEAFVRTRRVE